MQTDFRSDTITQATAPMRAAMAAAEVGDDVFSEDPTVNELQERMADLTGKEAALFLSSGTQSNLAAVLAHGQRGDEYLIGRNYHILINEASGASAFGGLAPWPLAVDDRGSIDPAEVASAVKEPDQHHPVTRMLCLENTTNGHVQSVELITELAAVAHQNDMVVHLDGARLFNAAAALEVPISAFTSQVETASLCLSKGLGAPTGSVLVGDKKTIAQAFRMRKMLGGGTRQAGHLAAAGLYALDHHVERLVEDHRRAERIAAALSSLEGLGVVQATNMLWITPPAELHDALDAHLTTQGIGFFPWKPTMRLVTHLGIDDQAEALLISSFQEFFAR